MKGGFVSTFVLVLCFYELRRADGYSSGAPKVACQSLTPQHLKTEPLKSKDQYKIELSTYHILNISHPPTVEVTIQSSERVRQFRGFMIQARCAVNKTVTGHFKLDPGAYQLLECNEEGVEDTATHYDAKEKYNITLLWKPPRYVFGPVSFYAAVVYDFKHYWVNVMSEVMLLGEV